MPEPTLFQRALNSALGLFRRSPRGQVEVGQPTVLSRTPIRGARSGKPIVSVERRLAQSRLTSLSPEEVGRDPVVLAEQRRLIELRRKLAEMGFDVPPPARPLGTAGAIDLTNRRVEARRQERFRTPGAEVFDVVPAISPGQEAEAELNRLRVQAGEPAAVTVPASSARLKRIPGSKKR